VNVMSCGMAMELLWNIVDNAFKHGGSEVVIRATEPNGKTVILEIEDNGGGLPRNVIEFMNTPDVLRSPVAPGLGLGVILIRGLAVLCGVQLAVSDRKEDSNVIGTRFELMFNGAQSTATT
ncbi:ATP-binding protein, partial [Candidatus Thorarchaeota archaeon]